MKKLRILIVDDMKKVHEILNPLSRKYEIDNAYSKEGALMKIEKNDYSCVLTDYHLGNESPQGGLEVIKAAKRKGIDSILMSNQYLKEEALKAGARGFVFKRRLFNKYNSLWR